MLIRIFLPLRDSRMMACNYFFNGGPCVYRNVNVHIITGSAVRLRMSSLSGCQSLLKIAGQISMRRCHSNWQTESAAAFKLTNIRAAHERNYSIKEKTGNGWPFEYRKGKKESQWGVSIPLTSLTRWWKTEREKPWETACSVQKYNEVLHNIQYTGLFPFRAVRIAFSWP